MLFQFLSKYDIKCKINFLIINYFKFLLTYLHIFQCLAFRFKICKIIFCLSPISNTKLKNSRVQDNIASKISPAKYRQAKYRQSIISPAIISPSKISPVNNIASHGRTYCKVGGLKPPPILPDA